MESSPCPGPVERGSSLGLLASRPGVGSRTTRPPARHGTPTPRADRGSPRRPHRRASAPASSARSWRCSALEANRTVSADRLAEGLWGEEPPSSAPKMVQLYVSQLRRLLDGNGATIVTHGRGYELRLPADAVDVARFERLVDESRPREALALWRGEALADVADEPFAAAEIRRLDELRVHAHELAIEADLAAGRHADVIGELDGARRGAPAARAAARPADAGAVSLGASVRGARRLPPGARRARGADRRRARALSCSGSRRRSSRTTQHSTLPRLRRRPHRAAGAGAEPRRRRRMTSLVAVAVLSAAAGLLAFGVSRVTAPDRLPRIDENFVGAIDPDGGRITAQYRRRPEPGGGRRPAAARSGSPTRWTGPCRGSTASTIRSCRSTSAASRPRSPSAPARCGSPTASRAPWPRSIPGSNRVVQQLEVGNASRGVAAGFGALWVTSAFDGVVRRIDLGRPTRGRPIASARTRRRSRPAPARSGWRARRPARSPASTRGPARSCSAINVGNGPSAVAVGAGRGVGRQPPRRDGLADRPAHERRVRGRSRVGADPAAIAAGDGGVWVAGRQRRHGPAHRPRRAAARRADRRREQRLRGRDRRRRGVDVRRRPAGEPSRRHAPGHHAGSTRRIRCRSTGWTGGLRPRVVPAALAGVRRARRATAAPRGAAGATLVGALATDAPRPSDDGRTYVFTLRPGLRYSDGTPVRPEDFRASIERFLRVTRSAAFPAVLRGHRRGRPLHQAAGSLRPLRRDRDRCAGAHDHVHLDAPGRGVPAQAHVLVRVRRAGEHPAAAHRRRRAARHRAVPLRRPGTPERGGTLVRNPHFRSWPRRARPAGFADRIEVACARWASAPSRRSGRAWSRSGAAPRTSRPSPTRSARSSRRAASRRSRSARRGRSTRSPRRS